MVGLIFKGANNMTKLEFFFFFKIDMYLLTLLYFGTKRNNKIPPTFYRMVAETLMKVNSNMGRLLPLEKNKSIIHM